MYAQPMRRIASLLLLLVACTSATRQSQLPPLDRATALVQSAVDEGRIPGAILHVEQHGASEQHVFGARAIQPQREENRRDTIYDLASLTKVLATAPSIMVLAERGMLELDAPVGRYLPEFAGGMRDQVTVRHLLTHTSSLPAGLSLADDWSGYEEGIRRALSTEPVHTPGSVFLYSDVNFILLGEIVRKVSRRSLDTFAAENLYTPLQMLDTRFSPPASRRIAPTEKVDSGMLRGEVHDPTSRRMGGVAGHAGLFSSAHDVARFARMLLRGGELDGFRVMSSRSVELMTSIATPPEVHVRRGLGWDIDSGFSRPRGGFPLGSFGHTGWTGSFIWLDPSSSSFWFLLSNRVHPDGRGSVLDLQLELGKAISDALIGRASPAEDIRVKPAGAGSVLLGIDVLTARNYEPLRGRRVGLITNHTGRDRRGNPTIDLLRAAPEVELLALFTPEHGLRGVRDEKIEDGRDELSGLPVWSLYGERRVPSAEQLAGLDVVVFDIQDIGARYYTYISTMGLAMQAAAANDVAFMVLDRPNPIGGDIAEGPVAEGESIFTSFHPIALRHGMTVGELAQMFREELGIEVDLTVIPLQGWRRDQRWDSTGLPWVNPSPAIRRLEAALLYPALGILEASNLSVGRGSDLPFEQFGAPWLDGEALADHLNANLSAQCAVFETARFTPRSSVFAGEEVTGVRIRLVDETRCSMVELGLTIADALATRWPEWEAEKTNNLLRHRATTEAIQRGRATAEAPKLWEPELSRFLERRQKYLLYGGGKSKTKRMDR